jgi:hypothetical protein
MSAIKFGVGFAPSVAAPRVIEAAQGERGAADQMTRFAETVLQPMQHAVRATA